MLPNSMREAHVANPDKANTNAPLGPMICQNTNPEVLQGATKGINTLLDIESLIDATLDAESPARMI